MRGVTKCAICGTKVFIDTYDNAWSHFSLAQEESHNAEVDDEDRSKE